MNSRASRRRAGQRLAEPQHIPSVWIEELAGPPPEPAPIQIFVSMFPDSFQAKLAERGLNAREIMEDFRTGFLVERSGSRYSLRSRRFQLGVFPKAGKDTRARLSCFAFAEPHDERQANWVHSQPLAPGLLAFVPIYEERPCDVEWLLAWYASHREEKRDHERLRREAALGLTRTSPARHFGHFSKLERRFRVRYGALRDLFAIVEKRFEDLPPPSVDAEIIVEPEDFQGGPAEQADGPDPLWVQLVRPMAALNVGGRVELLRGGEEIGRGRVIWLEGETVLLGFRGPIRPDPGEQVRVALRPSFDRKNHKDALRKMFAREVAGDWPSLVQLLTAPETLPAPRDIPPPFWFAERAEGRSLYDAQKRAVVGALNAERAFFIQGPPGTGKTTVISEIVQQLAHRGERVLMVAPTHVAVDEVLRRVGGQPGMLAVRLARKEENVSPELARFHDEAVHRDLARLIRRPGDDESIARRTRRAALEVEHASLMRLAEMTREKEQSHAILTQATTRIEGWAVRIAAEVHSTREEIRALEAKLRSLDGSLARAQADEEASSERYDEQWEASGIHIRLGMLFGLGALASLRHDRDLLRRKVEAIAADHSHAMADLDGARSRLDAVLAEDRRERPRLTREFEVAAVAHQAAEERWAEASRTVPRGANLSGGEIALAIQECVEEAEALDRSIRLEDLWFECAGMDPGSLLEQTEAVADEIGRELVESANLVAATTVAIGSHPRVRSHWQEFDTLIVDEASRVTDAEFLIGGLRSRRWIMVGDQHQLPPFVDQVDEHLTHALAALLMAERGAPGGVAEAIDRLAAWWAEDEELRQFRHESVREETCRLLGLGTDLAPEEFEAAIAAGRDPSGLIALGPWHESYRRLIAKPFDLLASKVADHVEEEASGTEPYRELLRTMLNYMVRSLFERCLARVAPRETDPAQAGMTRPWLSEPLVVQQRMRPALAELVRAPIYGGNYLSPPDDALPSGLAPLRLAAPYDKDLLFLATDGHPNPWDEQQGSGFTNRREIDWIVSCCRRFEDELTSRGDLEPVSVAILCFYQAQATAIEKRLLAENARKPFRALKLFNRGRQRIRGRVFPIDRIQGQESDLVFISFVRTRRGRSLPGPNFGAWLQDYRRLNVACTRARRRLVLVGHRRTLMNMALASERERAKAFYTNLFELIGRREPGGPYGSVEHDA